MRNAFSRGTNIRARDYISIPQGKETASTTRLVWVALPTICDIAHSELTPMW